MDRNEIQLMIELADREAHERAERWSRDGSHSHWAGTDRAVVEQLVQESQIDAQLIDALFTLLLAQQGQLSRLWDLVTKLELGDAPEGTPRT